MNIYDINRWLKQAEIAATMSLEALLANLKPYDERLHQMRGFSGAIRSSRAMIKCFKNILKTKMKKADVQEIVIRQSEGRVTSIKTTKKKRVK